MDKEDRQRLAGFICAKRPELTERSAQQYAYKFARVVKLLGPNVKGKAMSHEFVRDNQEGINALMESFSQAGDYSAWENACCGLYQYSLALEYPEEATKQLSRMQQQATEARKEWLRSQTKTSKQKENWVELRELRRLLRSYEEALKEQDILDASGELGRHDYELLRKWVTGSLYIGTDGNPPVRLDYGAMQVINNREYVRLTEEERKSNNYLVIVTPKSRKFFSFGDYKTADKYGLNIVKVSPKLNRVLNIWLGYNKGKKYLLGTDVPMSSVQQTRLIQSVFAPSGKTISASMLRHIFISEKFPAQLDERSETARRMMHSNSTQEDYAKHQE